MIKKKKIIEIHQNSNYASPISLERSQQNESNDTKKITNNYQNRSYTLSKDKRSITMRREDREKKKKKDLKSTLKLWFRHNQYHKKDVNEMNLTTLKKVINSDLSEPHTSSKNKWAIALRREKKEKIKTKKQKKDPKGIPNTWLGHHCYY